jgi:hypothetical protein
MSGPKSREETPEEGMRCGMRTASHYNNHRFGTLFPAGDFCIADR